MLLYQLDLFLPAHMPVHDFTYPGLKALKRNDHMLQGAELLGLGVRRGREDIVRDSQSNVLCTGCEDGRIKRVTVNNSDKPFGRLLSFDPVTKKTKVLLHHLYVANGVTVSPDQTFLVFLRRYSKYHIKGKESGRPEKFIENLPGIPDNIRYDGQGLHWIAFALEFKKLWDLTFLYRSSVSLQEFATNTWDCQENAGVMAVDLEGKPIAHYHDPGIPMISSGIKIGDHLYCGSICNPYILRLDLNQHPAHETT
ncbi:hypothetical protein Pint_28635 [Pistacia integerrima]|uniref:Uncharacterized protein n=1 Tax=Pistacia integerrima TaxID=434235 RepID=A0ACC0YTB3_9ROSI|nr:hypothetical protein Pint_28635 [Pistacia integerrima]